MNVQAYTLRNKIIEVIVRPQYQPGIPDAHGKPATWCNHAAHDILHELGVDTRPILHAKGIGWTGATAMYENAVAAASHPLSGVIEVKGRMAQALANYGIPILAAAPRATPTGHGHVAIVAPDDSPYDEARGPFTGDAGAMNDFKYAVPQFAGLSPIKYFLLPPMPV